MKYNLQKYLASLMKITIKVNSIATIQSECHKHDSVFRGGKESNWLIINKTFG